jgi:hypothetical protein
MPHDRVTFAVLVSPTGCAQYLKPLKPSLKVSHPFTDNLRLSDQPTHQPINYNPQYHIDL